MIKNGMTIYVPGWDKRIRTYVYLRYISKSEHLVHAEDTGAIVKLLADSLYVTVFEASLVVFLRKPYALYDTVEP